MTRYCSSTSIYKTVFDGSNQIEIFFLKSCVDP